jgi:hypothetical protein
MNFNKKNLIVIGVFVVVAIAIVVFVTQQKPQEPVKTPVVGYPGKELLEVLSVPIDPNVQPAEHEALYRKAIDFVPFPVLMPTSLPEGYKAMEIKIADVKSSSGEKFGSFSVTYKNQTDSVVLSASYNTEAPAGPDIPLEKVDLNNGKVAYFLVMNTETEKNVNTLSLGRPPEYLYVISSKKLQMSQLTDIANSLRELQ